ncbi:alpha/beta fold hydrolase [Krasilnikoviella flava]|uniref:Pimeloyl-ACP methyl ester carboxylesterase n=1 Tax=Krasilnikoviella flava TaxID=526729 RepID=A0A1T5INX0_9MICO|nr:alpha/beta hydrolase [Krasilnikoviella flava]SKC40819.1 Pimeloyl-ACP methyl ester carboxylesterase [Krasilnikoviella flava]
MRDSAPGAHRDAIVRGIHVVVDGPPDALPLLLVHGSGATAASWSPMVPGLDAVHRVVAIDLPGCGRSAPAPAYDVPAQADRVAGLVDELGMPRLRVVGHSSGGYVATALAERRPDLVGSLVLLSTGPAPDAKLPEAAVVRFLVGRPFGPLLWPLRTPGMLRRGIRSVAARPVDVPDDFLADVRRTRYRDFRQIMAGYEDYLAARSLPERLTAVGAPLLVVFGDADPRWDPASAHRYEAVPGARVAYLAGVGHVAMLEDPQGATRLVLDGAA